MVVRLFLLLAVVCQSRGQLFYDLGNGIFDDGAEIITDTSDDRKMCYDSSTDALYFVDGAVDSSEIRQRASDGTVTTIRDVTGAVIDSISCECNTLAFTYRLNDRTYLVYVNLGDDGVYIEKDLGAATVTAVRLQREFGTLVVVSATGFYKFSLDVAAGSTDFVFTTALSNQPKCVAIYQDTNTNRWYLFISFGFRLGIVVVCFDNTIISQLTMQVQQQGGFNARIACLDVDGDRIFFLHDGSGNPDWEISSYDVDGWFEAPAPIYSSPNRVRESSGNDESFDDCVNGLEICGTACEATCDDACLCGDMCGFCAAGDDTCQCQNSLTDCCVYEDATLSDACASRLPPINAMCVIKNARAQRRRSDVVQVLGVSQIEAVITIERRTAPTGRWDNEVLPPRTYVDVSGPPLWINGFRAATQSSARGKRFGVFLADINPDADGLLSERINCIVTEASKFINKYYTYCSYVGGSVTLEAIGTTGSQVNMNLEQIRWRFTMVDLINVDVGTPTVPNCVSDANPLTCTLNDLSLDDEGIYEVYRMRRYLRTWHPIFCLAVRACPDNEFGASCSPCNPVCVHGKCDDSGECVCYPGWMGEACDVACTGEGTVGQGCDIECSDICTGNTDCKDLLFCLPGKIGCYCRSGLKPPDCWQPCPQDTWGPNCMMTCNDCNPRIGP